MSFSINLNGNLTAQQYSSPQPVIKAEGTAVPVPSETAGPLPINTPAPPQPLVVNESGSVESTTAEIDAQKAVQANQSPSQITNQPQADNSGLQIKQVEQQQSQVNQRQESLSQERAEIDSEIRALQAKEQELTRKKSQLSNESSLGSQISVRA
jgi:hypothetical protein